ncbi:hypothetical protein FBY31_0605 [Arthrobacter sp. SLBN-100]|nr:hypothetical protein FBY31_0605 [Arthrobacter sp. SLBN-100]
MTEDSLPVQQPQSQQPYSTGANEKQEPGRGPYPPAQALRGQQPAVNHLADAHSGQPKTKASGRRTAGGIVGIVLGVFLLVPALVMLEDKHLGFMSFLIFLAALGNIVGGVMMLLKLGTQTRWAPVTLLIAAVAAVMLGIIGPLFLLFNLALLMVSLALAIPIGILILPELAEQRRNATPQQPRYPPRPYAQVPAPHAQAPVPYLQGTQSEAYHATRQPSPGARKAAGIVAIALGAWELAASQQGYAMYIDYDGNLNALSYALMFLVLGVATAGAGIALLVLGRRKKDVVPVVLIGLAALAILVGVSSTVRQLYAVIPTAITALLAVAVLILLGIELAAKKRHIDPRAHCHELRPRFDVHIAAFDGRPSVTATQPDSRFGMLVRGEAAAV